MRKHEESYVHYHLQMVMRRLNEVLNSNHQTVKNHEMPRIQMDHVDQALTHIDSRMNELTRQTGDNMMEVQCMKSEIQSRNVVTEEAIGKLQHAGKELQDYYTDLALSIQSLQATNYNGFYVWKIPDLTRRRRDAVLGKTVSLYSAPFFTSRHGYKICLRVYLNGDGSGRGSHVSFFLTIMKGEYDPLLPWPYRQTTTISFQMTQTEMNVASGCPQFCPQRMLENPSYRYKVDEDAQKKMLSMKKSLTPPPSPLSGGSMIPFFVRPSELTDSGLFSAEEF